MVKVLSLLVFAIALLQTTAYMGLPLGMPRMNTVRSTGVGSMDMRARVCDLLGKSPNRQARRVTWSHQRNKRVQHVNLQWKRFYSDHLRRNVRLRLSTKGIKTVHKYGSIDAAAKKFDVDLREF